MRRSCGEIVLDVGEHCVEGVRDAAGVDGFDEEASVAQVAAGLAPEEAVELEVGGATAPFRLLLKRAE